MRLNRYIALSTGISRRAADSAITENRVQINGQTAKVGQEAGEDQTITLDGNVVTPPVDTTTILFNKPVGYVSSRDGQGSKTIYDLLPQELHELKPVGRLDKESSGLLLLTNDGKLAHELTHPSRQKVKIYEVTLGKPLAPLHRQMIQDHGIELADGNSKFSVERIKNGDDLNWRITMHEGRNRQIRRTFAPLGYRVIKLHRTNFGNFTLNNILTGKYEVL